jgi:hypothetical protein
MSKEISEYSMAYEAKKVFSIRKMKTQFTNRNTLIFYAQAYYRSMQCRRKLFLIGGLRTRAEGPRKFLNLESLKLKKPFPGFWGKF